MNRGVIGPVERSGWPVHALLPAGALALIGPLAEAPGAETDPVPDKSRYTLFNPTPPALMRELNTDRPDKTESPFTVDAGHFQIEADILSYSYDRSPSSRAGVRVETVNLAPMNLKMGLRNDVDVQLVVENYVAERTHDLSTGAVQKSRGFGDLLIRSKWNVWGNDGGATALGVMPYLKLPTRREESNSVEGGVVVPFAADLSAGWSLGLMTQYDLRRDASGSGYHPEFLNSITFGHDIVGDLAGYAEFFSAVSSEAGSDWVGTVDVGFTYRLTTDIQLDGGVNVGVTRAADDFNPFMGISWRF